MNIMCDVYDLKIYLKLRNSVLFILLIPQIKSPIIIEPRCVMYAF